MLNLGLMLAKFKTDVEFGTDVEPENGTDQLTLVGIMCANATRLFAGHEVLKVSFLELLIVLSDSLPV